MSKQKVKLFEVLVKEPVKGFDRIRVELSYDKGGWNGSARGYYIMAFPAKVEERGMMTVGLFMGASSFIEVALRFSAVRLKQLAVMACEGKMKYHVDRVLAQVKQRNGMTIVGEPIYFEEVKA